MAKEKKVSEMSLDDLVRHHYWLLLDMKSAGNLAEDDALWITGHEILTRFNPPNLA